MKRSSTTKVSAQRAWRLLRIALLWARKGGLLKCRLVAELRLIPKHLKALKHATNHHHHHHHSELAYYGERELSFDETPVFHLRMSRPSSLRFKMPHIPCIQPGDYDFDFDHELEPESYRTGGRNSSFLLSDAEANQTLGLGGYDDDDHDDNGGREDDGQVGEDEGIDMKAEEFIAKFYREMKLQRQMSYLQYTDTINRGTS